MYSLICCLFIHLLIVWPGALSAAGEAILHAQATSQNQYSSECKRPTIATIRRAAARLVASGLRRAPRFVALRQRNASWRSLTPRLCPGVVLARLNKHFW